MILRLAPDQYVLVVQSLQIRRIQAMAAATRVDADRAERDDCAMLADALCGVLAAIAQSVETR